MNSTTHHDNPYIKKQYLSSLTLKQKEAIGLLSIGTFLEYFDLMLYVHMAILLNELFFPKTDPHTEQLLAAFAFCSTYIMRPIGALIFGWLGDNIGRKTTVIITTFIMALSCVVMASLPTYAQIGITATWIVTICRIMQGMSSMGESIGAQLYLTEITRPPAQYPIVGIIYISTTVGSVVALGVAALVTSYGFDWRIGFWMGAVIALVGTVARSTLRETPVFADAKKRMENALKTANQDVSVLHNTPVYQEKTLFTTAISLFLLECGSPMCFYLIYIYCGGILKNQLGFTAAQVIQQNLIMAVISLIIMIITACLSYRIQPITILKVKALGFFIVTLFCPYLFFHATTPFDIAMIQFYLILFGITSFPATPIFYQCFPVFKRFTYGAVMYALSRSVNSVIASFGLVFFTFYLGSFGILALMLPVLIGFIFGIRHFEKLEKARVSNRLI